MIVVEWSQVFVLSRPTNLDICVLVQLHVSVMQGRWDLIFSGAWPASFSFSLKEATFAMVILVLNSPHSVCCHILFLAESCDAVFSCKAYLEKIWVHFIVMPFSCRLWKISLNPCHMSVYFKNCPVIVTDPRLHRSLMMYSFFCLIQANHSLPTFTTSRWGSMS